LIKIGFSILEAVKLTSSNAAKYLNRSDIGSLKVGNRANFLVLDKGLELSSVYLNGNKVYG